MEFVILGRIVPYSVFFTIFSEPNQLAKFTVSQIQLTIVVNLNENLMC